MVGAVVVGDSVIGASVVVGVIVDGDEDGGISVVGSSVRVVVIVDVDSVMGDSVMGASASIVGVNDGRSVVGSSVGIGIVVVAVLATVAIVIVVAVVAVVVGGIAVVVKVAATATSSPSSAAVVASTSSIVLIDALPSTIVVVVVVLPSPTTLSSTMTIIPSSMTPVLVSFQVTTTSKLHGLAVINDDRNTSSSTSRPYFTISPVVGSIMSGTCISYHPSLDPHGLLGVDDDVMTVELFFDDDDDMAVICIFGKPRMPMYLVAYWRTEIWKTSATRQQQDLNHRRQRSLLNKSLSTTTIFRRTTLGSWWVQLKFDST